MLKEFLSTISKKSQGLPIYAVMVIILGVIILAIVLVYILIMSGKGTDTVITIFNLTNNTVGNATDTANRFADGGSLIL